MASCPTLWLLVKEAFAQGPKRLRTFETKGASKPSKPSPSKLSKPSLRSLRPVPFPSKPSKLSKGRMRPLPARSSLLSFVLRLQFFSCFKPQKRFRVAVFFIFRQVFARNAFGFELWKPLLFILRRRHQGLLCSFSFLCGFYFTAFIIVSFLSQKQNSSRFFLFERRQI